MTLKGKCLYIWLAALIDGEGSIMLNKRVYSFKERKRNLHFRATVAIANTDYRLMEALVDNTGIKRIYRHKVAGDPRTPRRRSQWTWRWANEDIRKWLPKVRPYLVLKGEQADLLLEALYIKQQITPGNAGFFPHNRGPLVAKLGQIYLEIRKLNQRGRVILEKKT